MSDDVADQLQMNRQTWEALQEQGVVPGSELAVDAFFFADLEETAGQLAAGLRGLGWTVETAASRQGLLRRRTLWSLQAHRVLGDISLQVLDDMVTSLDAEAARYGAEFDGWGAEAPGGAAT
jgi:hypothetical protein